MILSSTLALTPFLIASVQAHLSITYPPPFRSKSNPLATNINFDINDPIKAAEWPCSGDSGPSATILKAGQQQNITFSSGAIHGGGSCQAALSYDQKTFYVIHSWQGGCPNSVGGSLTFTVPADAKAGEATFIWTWFNKIGNREVYANCAGVTIEAGSGGSASIPFESRPDLFVANLDNGCSVLEGQDVTFPNPGPDVTGAGTLTVTGCQPLNGIGNSARGGGSSGGSSPQPAPSQAPPASSQASPPSSSAPTNVVAPPADSPSSAPSPTATSGTTPSTPNDLPLSPDGTCGSKYKCRPGFCCSSAGFCGDTALHCANSKKEPVARRHELHGPNTPRQTPATIPCNGTAPSRPTFTSSVSRFPLLSTGTAPIATASIGTGIIGAPAPTGTSPLLPESPDGTCGDKYRCGAGFCCSSAGFCGSSVLHCGAGCQTQFGQCGAAARRWIAGGHGRWKTMLN